MNIQTKDSDGSVVIFGNPACPPAPKDGYTVRTVDVIPPRPDKTSLLRWVDPAGLTWVAPAPALATLVAALNASLLALFTTAPLQAQMTYSNLAGPNGSVTQLVAAGQLAAAAAGLQGMIDDDLIPPKYSALITQAIALVTAQEAAFAAVLPSAPAPAAPAS